MCGRVIQSSGPLRYAIVDGLNVRDSRVHNYPPRWNAAPSQDLLVIRRNHRTGEVSLDPLRWGLFQIGAMTRKVAESRSMANARPCTPCLPSAMLTGLDAASFRWRGSSNGWQSGRRKPNS